MKIKVNRISSANMPWVSHPWNVWIPVRGYAPVLGYELLACKTWAEAMKAAEEAAFMEWLARLKKHTGEQKLDELYSRGLLFYLFKRRRELDPVKYLSLVLNVTL